MGKLIACWNWKHRPVAISIAAIVVGILAIVTSASSLLQGPTATEPPNAAEWLSAVSTFWGAVATAIGAVVTAGALLIAALSYRKQVEDKHKAQAVSVTVGSRTEVTPAVSARKTINGYFPDIEKHFYFVRNDSQLPIYRVQLVVGHSNPQGKYWEVLAPGVEDTLELPFAPLLAFVRFTDSSGVAWQRESGGRLTEIANDYQIMHC